MQALVAHFGDREGAKLPCGLCDFCAPDQCEAQVVREPHDDELRIARAVIALLTGMDSPSSGNLHASVCDYLGLKIAADRDLFEKLLDSMAAAGWVEIRDASFTADGREVRYRKVSLTREGRGATEETDLGLVIRQRVERTQKARTKRSKVAAKTGGKAARGKTATAAAASAKKARAQVEPEEFVDAFEGNPALEEALKAWRLTEAKRKRVPAFRICSDKTIRTLAEERPQTLNELLQVSGIGIKLAEKYGAALLRILARA
jgi:DNA topoisomerase-3